MAKSSVQVSEELIQWLEAEGCGKVPELPKKMNTFEKYFVNATIHLRARLEMMKKDLKGTTDSKKNGKKTTKKLFSAQDDQKTKPDVKQPKANVKNGVTTNNAAKQVRRGRGKEIKDVSDEDAARPTRRGRAKDIDDVLDGVADLKIEENKGCGCKGDCKTKICGCRKKNGLCTEHCKCKSSCTNKNSEADQVRPAQETVAAAKDDSDMDDDSADEYSDESPEPNMNDTQELGTEEVDWEKHLAKLESCPKCLRKFFRNRLEKHVGVCINI